MVLVSSVVAWEIAVKRAIGKLTAPGDIEQWIDDSGFGKLPITVSHAVQSAALPWHHRDPFDRLLIAQARLEDLTIVTRDIRFSPYAVALVDAGQ